MDFFPLFHFSGITTIWGQCQVHDLLLLHVILCSVFFPTSKNGFVSIVSLWHCFTNKLNCLVGPVPKCVFHTRNLSAIVQGQESMEGVIVLCGCGHLWPQQRGWWHQTFAVAAMWPWVLPTNSYDKSFVLLIYFEYCNRAKNSKDTKGPRFPVLEVTNVLCFLTYAREYIFFTQTVALCI